MVECLGACVPNAHQYSQHQTRGEAGWRYSNSPRAIWRSDRVDSAMWEHFEMFFFCSNHGFPSVNSTWSGPISLVVCGDSWERAQLLWITKRKFLKVKKTSDRLSIQISCKSCSLYTLSTGGRRWIHCQNSLYNITVAELSGRVFEKSGNRWESNYYRTSLWFDNLFSSWRWFFSCHLFSFIFSLQTCTRNALTIWIPLSHHCCSRETMSVIVNSSQFYAQLQIFAGVLLEKSQAQRIAAAGTALLEEELTSLK